MDNAVNNITNNGNSPVEVDYGAIAAQQKIDAMRAKELEVITKMSIASGVVYSDEQKKILLRHSGTRVVSCAGSGKTTTIVHLVTKRILTGEIKDPSRVLCTTFSKPGATEMEKRLLELLKIMGLQCKVTVKTMHAVYLGIIKSFGYNVEVIKESDRNSILRDACKQCEVRVEDDTVETLETLIAFQVNNLFSDEKMFETYEYRCAADNINMSNTEYISIKKYFTAAKAKIGKIDFEDMQLIVYSLLNGQYAEQVRQYCRSLWDSFYVDEAQDLSVIQYEIFKLITPVGTKDIVFIGDDDQCIYEWRGANPRIIRGVIGDFEIPSLNISTNYRCPYNIVSRAAESIKYNKARIDKSIQAYKDGGIVSVKDYGNGNLYNMTVPAYQHIAELVKNGAKPSDIAVLVRNNRQACILGCMLMGADIYCDTMVNMRLTNMSIYRDMRALMEFGNADGPIASSAHTILYKIIARLRAKEAMLYEKIMLDNGMSIAQFIAFMAVEGLHLPGITASTPRFSRLAADRISAMCQYMNSETIASIKAVEKTLELKDPKERVLALIKQYNSVFLSWAATNSAEAERIYFGITSFISKLIDSKGLKEAEKFLDQYKKVESGELAVLGPKVTLTTMHSAKGREWKHVVIFADDSVSCPDLEQVGSMVESGFSDEEVSRYIEEARRLHYVAMTRAKETLTIFTSKSKISPFICEALGKTVSEYTTETANKIISQHTPDNCSLIAGIGLEEIFN